MTLHTADSISYIFTYAPLSDDISGKTDRYNFTWYMLKSGRKYSFRSIIPENQKFPAPLHLSLLCPSVPCLQILSAWSFLPVVPTQILPASLLGLCGISLHLSFLGTCDKIISKIYQPALFL